MRKLILLMVIIVLCGCSTIEDAKAEAHYVNAKRYIPMLKRYIQNDPHVSGRLKDVYYQSLDKWQELIEKDAGKSLTVRDNPYLRDNKK